VDGFTVDVLLRKGREKNHAPSKCKFFIWLILHDCCWTAERRKRHNLQDVDACMLCSQTESISHLLLNCSFARQIWHRVLQRLRWHALTPDDGHCFNLAAWWTSRKKLAKVDRKDFDTLVILTSWMI